MAGSITATSRTAGRPRRSRAERCIAGRVYTRRPATHDAVPLQPEVPADTAGAVPPLRRGVGVSPAGPEGLDARERAHRRVPRAAGADVQAVRAEQHFLHAHLRLPLPAHDWGALHLLAGA